MSQIVKSCLLACCLSGAPALAQPLAPFQIVHPSGATNDQFGVSVAISGDSAIVGACGVSGFQGSALIYRGTSSGWTLESTLDAADGTGFDFFGVSVAIFGDTAIVGAPSDDVGTHSDQGSAYIFTRADTTWTQQTQLTAFDGAVIDVFGTSVAISGDTAIVGSPGDDVGANAEQGSVYIFTRSGTTWTLQAKLIAPDGAAGDLFGASVAIAGNTSIVGVPGTWAGDRPNGHQGSAYIFTRSGTAWALQAQLTVSGGTPSDEFGSSVAISGNTAIVGAPFYSGPAAVSQGSAYVFTRSGTTWTQEAQLSAADGAFDDQFGHSVAVSDDTAIVGAWFDSVDSNPRQGSAYVFTRTNTAWTQQLQFLASDGETVDGFGGSVAISGTTTIVGAPGDNLGPIDEPIDNAGSAWLFSRCPADFNYDGNIDPDDLGDFINCYFAVPPCASADFNHDGDINADDLGDFINAYFGGC